MIRPYAFMLRMIIAILIMGIATTGHAATKTFPAGSYILPQDLCWQPNSDPKTVPICSATIVNTVANPYNCYPLTGCDTNKNDQGIFQSTGLVYEILDAGFPVYWIINPNKTNPIAIDFTITKSGTNPAVSILNSPKTDSGTVTTVEYRGGPFVIDANDYDTTMQALFDKYKGSLGNNGVKIHKSNYDFSAEVDKVLSGKPPEVAVLGEGSVQVLTDYLFASGLGNNLSVVFKYVTTPQIIAGALSDFQLLWAPHWEIQNEVPVVADRALVIGKIRSFLEAGNAGFFECASMESLERSYDVSNSTSRPSANIAGQGILLSKDYGVTKPTGYIPGKGRIDANGGSMDYDKMIFEHNTNVLTQCGGWRYDSTSGLIKNLRPSQQPNPDFVYNSGVERFIHDVDDSAVTGYAPKGYDYYIGGRINGSATQGYVAYLGGHKYVKCTNTNTATPVQRYLSLEFNADLVSSGVVYVELLYSGCVAGTTCPKAAFTLKNMTGNYDSDGTMFVDLDSAEFVPDADPATKYTLKNVIVGNKDPINTRTMTGINVTFSGNPTTTEMMNVIDMTDEAAPVTICSPVAPTPASCPAPQLKKYNLYFSAALVSGTTVTVEVVHSGCTAGVTCPKGILDMATNTKTSANDGKVLVWMTNATFNSATNSVDNVYVKYFGTTSTTLTRFKVNFTGNGLTKLSYVNDVTAAASNVCISGQLSTASCPPVGATAVQSYDSFQFNNDISTGTLYVEAVHSGCTAGSTCSKASFNIDTNVGTFSATDSNVLIDMRTANFDHSTKYLNNVILYSRTASNITLSSMIVSGVNVDGNTKLKRIKDGGTTLWSSNSGRSLPYEASITQDLVVAAQTLGINMSAPAPLDVVFGKAVTECKIDWNGANTCGMKYVLNTLIGLQFQVIPHEYTKAGAIQEDNILYKAAFEFPGYKGHLYSIDVKHNPALTQWDAGYKSTMPPAGDHNPSSPSRTNVKRYIFTNLPGTTTQIDFDVNQVGASNTDATKLWKYLYPTGTQVVNDVKALINSVRGRKEANQTTPAGTGEVSKRLGGIEHSTPAVMTKSKLAGAANRDRVVFVGADDGMLHAFYAGAWDSTLNSGKGGYGDAGTGKEIWAYIPSKLLSSLQNQTFTDCSPGENLVGCTPVVGVTTCVCPTFSVAVTVDGAPALGDFFVDHDNDPTTPKQWRTILVATAKVMTPGDATQSVNQGIIFALDVTDAYTPVLLWEKTYDATIDTSAAPGNAIKRNYYPVDSFTTGYKTGEDSLFDPNMGDAKGVSIGRVQVGTTLDTYVFLTSRWVRQVNTGTVAAPHNSWGLSVFALDFYSGDIKWETKILYTGDAEGINESPATPALLDYGSNGTYDYVVFGDLQGRLWVLKTVDGKSLTGDTPAYTVGAGAKEPIGVPVSIYKNKILFGTGGRDSLQDESTTKYHVYAIEINSSGEVTDLWTPPIELLAGEKVWSSPVIDSGGNVYVGTALGYTDVGRPDMVTSSTGRLLVINLATGKIQKDGAGNDMIVDLGGAVIGDIAVENNHITIQTFNGKSIQIGSSDPASFDTVSVQRNPVRVLWWRKL